MKGITGKFALLIVLALVVIGIGMAAKDSVGKKDGDMSSKVSSSQFAWSFQNVGTEEDTGAPMTAVTLRADGAPYDVGTYQGDCFVIEDSNWELEDNEVSGVICYFAGGGSEVGVFRENGALVVKTGQLDEGSAEIAGVRGNFTTLIKL